MKDKTRLEKNFVLFSHMGSMRGNSKVSDLFEQAYFEDKEMALRNIVHLRNIRLGGLGERDTTIEVLSKLVDLNTQDAIFVTSKLSYFGRWSDVVDMYVIALEKGNEELLQATTDLLKEQFQSDLDSLLNDKEVSLLGKWLPTINTRNVETRKLAERLAKDFKVSFKEYRKSLSKLRTKLNILEKNLVEKTYSNIDIESIPSLARFKNSQALNKHMPEEMFEFFDDVNKGLTTMKTTGLTPYDIINTYFQTKSYNDYREDLEMSWKNLEDVTQRIKENAIVVADTSGSMAWSTLDNKGSSPYKVALSLALYCSERLEGAFKNNFIVFSENPKLISLTDEATLRQKINEYNQHKINASNTDIQKVYDLILSTAVNNELTQEQLPSKIIIVSDMQFDRGVKPYSNYEQAREKYEAFGYDLPAIIFWNVNATQVSREISFDTNNVAQVSGLSPNIFNGILGKEIKTPVETMIDVLMSPNYDFIVQ